uniref:LOW QUALITY PROTEIN: UBX domain-containing protein 11-like n=1 Tax=Styela clava TaxID=7725 RepID=UPI001939AB2A|nr:LOW QUALITY PROTEIN: UBX domain-containing protein 11-like [Styela clava]
MTSPISSLSKGKKSPLTPSRSFGKRSVPFRMPEYTSSERALLNDITGITHHHDITGQSSPRHKDITGLRSSYSSSESSSDGPASTPLRKLLQPLDGSPKEMFNAFNGNRKPSPLGLVNSPIKGNSSTNVPSDMDLMTSMMQKIAILEKKNLSYTREILEKDKRIKVLEEKTSLLERNLKSGENESPSKVAELEAKCLELKQQVYEMETFLADYGMIWVGEKSNPNSNKYLDDEEINHQTPVTLNNNAIAWKPGSSVSGQVFTPDFDLIVENVNDLNILAGKGENKVAQTMGGAKLKAIESIPLTLYKNGIMMFSGPFRSYADQTTQRCLQDIMDGYFPSELQARYPDGVPIQVTDKRFVTFQDPRLLEEFPGVGFLLGGEEQPSNLLNSGLNMTSSASVRSSIPSSMSNNFDSTSPQPAGEVTSKLPGPQLSLEQFIGKLPRNVIRDGKIIDVRDSIADQLTASHTSSSSAEVIETQVVQEMQQRMNLPENQRPPTARNVATLRIKSEDGDKTLLIKMKFHETIGDLRNYINKQRHQRMSPYNIISTFPSKTYSDDSKTLQERGLVPNATLVSTEHEKFQL